jgi:hypothetical protein
VVIESSTFWDITPCSPFKVNKHFKEHVTYIFWLKEYAKEETSMQQGTKQSSASFLLGSFFDLNILSKV